jgi:hypothetical protein
VTFRPPNSTLFPARFGAPTYHSHSTCNEDLHPLSALQLNRDATIDPVVYPALTNPSSIRLLVSSTGRRSDFSEWREVCIPSLFSPIRLQSRKAPCVAIQLSVILIDDLSGYWLYVRGCKLSRGHAGHMSTAPYLCMCPTAHVLKQHMPVVCTIRRNALFWKRLHSSFSYAFANRAER